MDFLFVYGTLLKETGSEVISLLRENSVFQDSGTFRGSLFEVDGYPGAVSGPESESLVHGNVLSLRNPELVFRELDKYEEVGPEFPEPDEYIRSRIPVLCSSGETKVCWVYLYSRPTGKLKLISSGRYSNWLTGGQ